ncbi:MAG: response regulator [Patescibacteria group bacterium]
MPPSKEKKKILVTEDEKPLAKALELKLLREGYDVTVAHDGEQALSLLEHEKFDLVLLDLVMPKIDGFGVLTALQDRKSKTPVIVLTNLAQAEDVKRIHELGAKEYFIKSDIPLVELVQRIKTFFAS